MYKVKGNRKIYEFINKFLDCGRLLWKDFSLMTEEFRMMAENDKSQIF